MDYETYFERSNYLLEMSMKGRLISLSQAAEKFECTNRTISRMLARLRRQGHPIYYNRSVKRSVLKAGND